jgi:hypothetical protein
VTFRSSTPPIVLGAAKVEEVPISGGLVDVLLASVAVTLPGVFWF